MQKITPFHYFDGNFSMSDIKIIYVPQQGQAVPQITSYDATLAEPVDKIKEYIDSKWQQESDKELKKTGKPLQDETLVSVATIDLDSGDLDVIPTKYKRWKTTAKKEFYSQFGNIDIPNPLNVQTLVKTTDGQFVLGPRPGKDTLQLPGGMVNISDFRQTRTNNPLTIAAFREFNEEVAPIPVLNPSFLGTSFYAGRVLTTVFVMGEIEMSVDELMEYRQKNSEKIKDLKEFPSIESIGATKREMEVAIHGLKMQETAMIALLLYGHQNFGPQWIKRHCPPQMMAAHLMQKTR